MMDAMESREGFSAKADTRKEKWVHTTRLTLSDGARPIVGEEVKVKVGGKEYTTKTKAQGAIPPIVHVSDDSPVEIFLKTLEGHWQSIYSFVTGKTSRQLVATRDQQKFQGTARMTASGTKPQGGKDQTPLVYVVQSGDNLTKIARKFKTTVGELRKHNQGIVKGDLIFPGQKINIFGAAGAPSPTLASSPAKPAPKPKAAEPTTPVVSNKGQPLALVDPAQRQAPWMEVAIREAKQWAGFHESQSASEKAIKKKKSSKGVITDNYHKEVGVVIDGETPAMGTAWCALFVNYCLKESGNSYTKNPSSQFAATSKKFVEVKQAVYGAIVVYRHTKKEYGTGHTAFIYAKLSDGDYAVLGGNQGESITLNPHAAVYLNSLKSKLIGFFVPIEYKKYAEEVISKGGDLVDEKDMKELKRFIGDGTGNEAKTT